MVIGAGFGQLPAIKTAKKMGLRVLTIDKNPKAIGMKYADIALKIDLLDIGKAVKAAQKYKINGVMTMQSDFGINAVGKINDALSLEGSSYSYKVASRCNDKWKTRQCFYKHNVSAPLAYEVKTIKNCIRAATKIGFPCILKPADSSGSRGVAKIEKEEQIKKAFRKALKYSNLKSVCIEQFIKGIDLGAQTFSRNGKCVSVFVQNDTVTNPPYYVPIGHSFPSKLKGNVLEKVKKEIIKAVEALGIKSGPANIDIILDEKGKPYIIEVGPRIGATCLPELMYYHSHINWVEETIRACIGEKPDLTPKKNIACAALILESPDNGIFEGFEMPKKIYSDKRVLEIKVTAKKGDIVNKFKKGTDRIGKVVVKAKSIDNARKLAKNIKSQIKFQVKSLKNKK